MRALPAPEPLLRARDAEPIVIVPPQTWHCMFCDPREERGAMTTVEWLSSKSDGPDGRCRECGQRYAFAQMSGMLLREALRPEAVPSRLDHCYSCEPEPQDGSKPTVAWRGPRGRCAGCGQAYAHPARQPLAA
jgi:hypothetical protein